MNILKEYIRTIMEQEQQSSVYDIDVRIDNIEDVLKDLVSNIDDLDGLKNELGYDANNLVSDMKSIKHNDDMFHHGETILDHTREVLEDLEEYIQDMSEDRKKIIRLAALLHDIGKAVSYKWVEEKQKPTFHGHAEESMKIAERMLKKYAASSGEFLKNIIELVQEHDAFLHLVDQRGNSKSLKYLKKFSQKNVSFGETLDNLVAIAKADNKRAKSAEKDFGAIQGIVNDLGKYREQDKENERQKIENENKARANAVKYKDAIIKIANNAIPGAGDLYPNIALINRELGMKKKYGVIQQIKTILEEQ